MKIVETLFFVGLLLELIGLSWIVAQWLSTILPLSEFTLADYFGYFGASIWTCIYMVVAGALCMLPKVLANLR